LDYIFLPLASAYLLFKNYRESTWEKKEQVKYVTILYLLPIIGGFTNFFYWYNIPIPPWGNFLAFLYPVITGYTISRYRFTDMKFMIGRLMVYVFSVLSVIVPVTLFIMLNKELDLSLQTSIIFSFILVLSIFVYQLFFVFYEKIASRYFYKELYSQKKEIDILEKKLVSVLDADKLSSLVQDFFSKISNLDKSAIIFKENKNGDYMINNSLGFEKDDLNLIFKNDFLFNYLKNNKKSILSEEFINSKNIKAENLNDFGHYKKIIENKKIGLLLPLFNGSDLTGLIVLGRKKGGESYSKQDIELLETLSNQLSTVLENAKLYDQVQDLSQNLQQKVDEQTKELRQAYQTEKKAREELEKLDATKNQFLLAVQHHLRTPLTVMKWNSNMILQGKAGRQNKKTKEIVERFQNSTQGLIKIVNEFLDITQFQLGKEVVNLRSGVELEPILKDILEDVGFEAKNKNITLTLQKTDKVYTIMADKEKLKVALFNIIDNAVKYTDKGSVIISIIQDKATHITITIKDTGMGINNQDLSRLFNGVFERGEKAQKTFATGRGIGLYISSQIIKAHKGTITAESEGEGKGSLFVIKLPIG